MEGNKYLEKKNKKLNTWLKTVIILCVIILVSFTILTIKFVANKVKRINFQELDETNLSINDELQKDVNGLSNDEFNEVINILLLGSDSKDMSDQYAGNSDAIMIISINPKYKSIKLISIPRDTAAIIDGFEYRYKINAAFATGKEQLAVKTINQNFGLNLKEF